MTSRWEACYEDETQWSCNSFDVLVVTPMSARIACLLALLLASMNLAGSAA